MVRDALAFALEFKKMERETMEQLSPMGAGLPVDAVADVLDRLAVWRYWAVSLLIGAEKQANEQERRDIRAALTMVNSAV